MFLTRIRRITITAAVMFMLYPALVVSQGKVFLDVKTKLTEKLQLSPIKTATEILLLRTNWAGVLDYGAKYALWLRNYEKQESEDELSATVNLDVELRKPIMFGEGKLLASSHIKVSYRLRENVDEVHNAFDAVKQQLKTDSNKIVKEASAVGERVVEEARKMVNKVR